MAACLMALLFTSCGGDSKEKVLADSKDMMKEMIEIFNSITDKASAEAAKPKLEALKKKGEEMKKRLEALNLDKKALDEEAKNDPEMQKLAKDFGAAMMKVAMNKEAQEVLKTMQPGL